MDQPTIVSEKIAQVFPGPTCWVIYKDKAFNTPVRSTLYAVVNCQYDNGAEDSFVAPLIATKDGIMTWASYFSSFVGVLHQEDRPTDELILSFMKEIHEMEKQILKALGQNTDADDDTKEPASTIKFQSKRNPTKPDNNK